MIDLCARQSTNVIGTIKVLFLNSHPRIGVLILEREEGRQRERERQRERNINRLPPVRAPTGCQTHSLGRGPDKKSDPQPFGVQNNAPTN